jgi:hypothetical protein
MREFPQSVPYGADQTVYLVVEGPGQHGIARKTERADIETVIADLMSGQFNDPIEVVAFNTLEHWTDALSNDIARVIRCRCDIDGLDVPVYLDEFVGRTFA